MFFYDYLSLQIGLASSVAWFLAGFAAGFATCLILWQHRFWYRANRTSRWFTRRRGERE